MKYVFLTTHCILHNSRNRKDLQLTVADYLSFCIFISCVGGRELSSVSHSQCAFTNVILCVFMYSVLAKSVIIKHRRSGLSVFGYVTEDVTTQYHLHAL